MKKILLLPLILLLSCSSFNSATKTSGKVYENVDFVFDIESHCYIVGIYSDTSIGSYKEYKVPPKNYYYVQVYEWTMAKDNNVLRNEYFLNINELFEYYRK